MNEASVIKIMPLGTSTTIELTKQGTSGTNIFYALDDY